MVGGSPAPLSESGEHEGYPGIAHDFEEIRSALRDLRDYVAAEHGIGGIQPLVPDCPKCERIKKLDALLWRAQTPPSASREKAALRRLLACINTHDGHGTPSIRDRAECYVAMQDAQEALK